MAETTTNSFKSVVSNILNTKQIYAYMGYTLYYQNKFKRRTTPREYSYFNYEEFNKFKINYGDIDRLYHISHFESVCGEDFEMIARMEYKGEKLYIELLAGCKFTSFNCYVYGTIFVSKYANLFMKIINKGNMSLIHKSLTEDGIETEEITEHESIREISGVIRQC